MSFEVDTGAALTSASIVGTTTNDDAAAGSIGEYKSTIVLVGAKIDLTTATPVNIASVSLTAGDWDVDGQVWFIEAAGTVGTEQNAAISTTTGTLPTVPANGTALARQSGSTPAADGSILPTGTARISVAATTIVYLVAQATFTVSTNAAYGIIRARRIR